MLTEPNLFIGSSKQHERVANLIAEALEPCSKVTVWNEGFFELNQGVLETLLTRLEESDFAVFVLAPDDLTTSKGETLFSARDNVLFESGLFMGKLGRERVFLAIDESAQLKIPSDLAGITLARYDGSRIAGDDGLAAVRTACRLIGDAVAKPRLKYLVGTWQSRYPMPFESGCPINDDVVEIRPWRDGVSIISTRNPKGDEYGAFGRQPQPQQLVGEWKSRADKGDNSGSFILTANPNWQFMYGYWTSPDETGGVAYAPWVLANHVGTDADGIKARLKRAEEMLAETTVGFARPTTTEIRPSGSG